MNRLLVLVECLEKGQLNKAYRLLYNYYGQIELYKGDYLKTLLLVDEYINGIITLDDVKRSVNTFRGRVASKFAVKYADDGVKEEYYQYNIRADSLTLDDL